jgi:hypothetical protein
MVLQRTIQALRADQARGTDGLGLTFPYPPLRFRYQPGPRPSGPG